MKHRGIIMAGAAAALVLTSSAHAQHAEQQQQQARRGGQQAQQQQEQQLRGTVREMKDVRVRGAEDPNRIVLLETNRGTIAVDLGAATELQAVNIRRGTPIAVQGTLVEVDDRMVFLAQRVRIGQEQFEVQRGTPEQRAGMQQQRGQQLAKGQPEKAKDSPRMQQFSGQITRIQVVGIRGTDVEVKVATLQTRRGQQVKIELGPEDQLQALDLQAGDRIQGQAVAVPVGGQKVLIAKQIQAGGKFVEIEREALPIFRGTGQQQQRQQQQQQR